MSSTSSHDALRAIIDDDSSSPGSSIWARQPMFVNTDSQPMSPRDSNPLLLSPSSANGALGDSVALSRSSEVSQTPSELPRLIRRDTFLGRPPQHPADGTGGSPPARSPRSATPTGPGELAEPPTSDLHALLRKSANQPSPGVLKSPEARPMTTPPSKSVSFGVHETDVSGPLTRQDRGMSSPHTVMNTIPRWRTRRRGADLSSINRTWFQRALAGEHVELERSVQWWLFLFALMMLIISFGLPDWRRSNFCCVPYHQEPIQLGIVGLRVPYPEGRNFSYPATTIYYFSRDDGFDDYRRTVSEPKDVLAPPDVGVEWAGDLLEEQLGKFTGLIFFHVFLLATSLFMVVFSPMLYTSGGNLIVASGTVIGLAEVVIFTEVHHSLTHGPLGDSTSDKRFGPGYFLLIASVVIFAVVCARNTALLSVMTNQPTMAEGFRKWKRDSRRHCGCVAFRTAAVQSDTDDDDGQEMLLPPTMMMAGKGTSTNGHHGVGTGPAQSVGVGVRASHSPSTTQALPPRSHRSAMEQEL